MYNGGDFIKIETFETKFGTKASLTLTRKEVEVFGLEMDMDDLSGMIQAFNESEELDNEIAESLSDYENTASNELSTCYNLYIKPDKTEATIFSAPMKIFALGIGLIVYLQDEQNKD